MSQTTTAKSFLQLIGRTSFLGFIVFCGLNLLPQPASAQSQTQQIVNAFFNSGYSYCDAQMLATAWQTNPYGAKIRAGKMILGYAAFPGRVSNKLAAARRTYSGQGVCNYSSNFSYEDAVALAAYWNIPVETAKSSLTSKLEYGNLALAKKVVREAYQASKKSDRNQPISSRARTSSLTNLFTGRDKCLDIINDGRNDRVTMAECGNFTGQQWTLSPSRANSDTYRLTTQFTGTNKCLDIINDGRNNRLTMATCGNFSGQFWKLSPSNKNSGTYRLTTQFTGASKCLDIINDGTNNRLTMAQCGDFSGQYWVKSDAP
ncbi:RICIN domain-containing protein [Chamaesiphon minutus]|uniref:Putative carbohydrate-binding protein n=1 Tax=Chamaesiphon minutus (strain ATCC 27169 / PCC 6605) TaxID=1173020 RepID=K9UNB6_CHAP6|nr:RICIN domain-containing protein [Chamaesiphon minutus]AFY96168.1 putative carbohydrate-binding protein [Chamaesiphon minutus PCC 6605]